MENKIEQRFVSLTLPWDSGNSDAKSAECGKRRKLLVRKTRRASRTREGEIARVASNETSCDESFVARVRAYLSLSLFIAAVVQRRKTPLKIFDFRGKPASSRL